MRGKQGTLAYGPKKVDQMRIATPSPSKPLIRTKNQKKELILSSHP
jgi:hypothetical protein